MTVEELQRKLSPFKPQSQLQVQIGDGGAILPIDDLILDLGVGLVLRAEEPCEHDFQMHPGSDDFGVCSKCGADA